MALHEFFHISGGGGDISFVGDSGGVFNRSTASSGGFLGRAGSQLGLEIISLPPLDSLDRSRSSSGARIVAKATARFGLWGLYLTVPAETERAALVDAVLEAALIEEVLVVVVIVVVVRVREVASSVGLDAKV